MKFVLQNVLPQPNVTAWTPHLLNQFLKVSGNVCDLSSFKYIAIGGSAIEKPLLDKFQIVSEEGKIVDKPFETGELWIKGDAFFKEYFEDPEATQLVLTGDGWLETGYIFYKDVFSTV